jgi:hypothetical protein
VRSIGYRADRKPLIFLALGAVVLIGGMAYMNNVADGIDPQTREIRVELPNALGN